MFFAPPFRQIVQNPAKVDPKTASARIVQVLQLKTCLVPMLQLRNLLASARTPLLVAIRSVRMRRPRRVLQYADGRMGSGDGLGRAAIWPSLGPRGRGLLFLRGGRHLRVAGRSGR